jgi:1,4-alpha-glucan branching enzyme
LQVHISGGFNQWSATASPLHKQEDGTFKGDIALPWGEKQAFKYVVDGEWKVREDEAKEWGESSTCVLC